MRYVDGADQDLEIGALYELSLEDPAPPVLVFRNIKGFPSGHRVVVNVRSSKVFDNGEEGLERVQVYRKHRRRKADPIPPVVVKDGPVLQNVLEGDAIDVHAFPAPKWHEGDGGRYIGTECLVITRDPDSDWVNLGNLSGPGARQKHACGFHRAGQARRRDPPEILGARPALPDGHQRRPVTGTRRRRAGDARSERIGI